MHESTTHASTSLILTPSLSLNREEFETTGHRFLCDDGATHATVVLGEDGETLFVVVAPADHRAVQQVLLWVRTTSKERFPLEARPASRLKRRPKGLPVGPCFVVSGLPGIPDLEEVGRGAVWSVQITLS